MSSLAILAASVFEIISCGKKTARHTDTQTNATAVGVGNDRNVLQRKLRATDSLRGGSRLRSRGLGLLVSVLMPQVFPANLPQSPCYEHALCAGHTSWGRGSQNFGPRFACRIRGSL